MMYDEDHESDYEDGEDEMFNLSFKPSYVVIGIDNHPTMFQRNEDGEMPFRACLQACFNLADSLLLVRDKRAWSPFAVIITGQSTPLISFDKNMLESIKLLKQKSTLPNADLIKEFQRKGTLDLGGFFLTCKKLFHDVKSVFYRRSLIYLSNDDKPIFDKNAKFTALNEIKTFSSSQIDFQIIPNSVSFNYKLFYNELYNILGTQKQEEICTDAEGLTQKLSSLIMVKVNEKRVMFYPFKGDNSRFLKCLRVFVFGNIHLNNSYMTKNGEKVINTNMIGDVLPFYRVKFVNDEKGNNVRFDPMEKSALEDFTMPKGYVLMFVADRQVGIGHIFSKPILIKEHPKEELPFFRKFWDNCVATNKVLVCMTKYKQPDKVRYCELIPVLVNDSPMFIEKRLPFGNEIVYPMKREYPEEEVSADRRQIVEKLVDKLTFNFDLKMVPDIVHQKKKAYVRAKLLEEPLEHVHDLAVNKQQLDLLLEDLASTIKDKFDLSDASKKRKHVYYSHSHRNKKVK